MNRDIIRLIHDEESKMYKSEIEKLQGYVDMSEEEFLLKHPMIKTVLESEKAFDPFMIRESFSDEIEKRWLKMMLPIFFKFLDELSEEEYMKIKEDINTYYGNR